MRERRRQRMTFIVSGGIDSTLWFLGGEKDCEGVKRTRIFFCDIFLSLNSFFSKHTWM